MAKYQTKQRNLLLDYFVNHTDESLSARQIADELDDEDISASAVYRNLAALEDEGMVKRSSKAGSREVFFQYLDDPECRKSIHLTCKICGRIIHMDDLSAKELIENVEKNLKFKVDKAETVLFGVCEDCSK